MIFIERPPEEGFLYNKDELSILAAKEGVEVEKVDKKGIYLNDDFQLINGFSDEREFIGNVDEVMLNHRKLMLYLLDKLQVKRQSINTHLNKFNKYLPKIRIKGRDYYQLSKEEADVFIHLYKTKQKFILKYMPLKEAKDFLKKYISARDLGITYIKTAIKLKINKKFHHVTLSKKNFFLREDAQEIRKMKGV